MTAPLPPAGWYPDPEDTSEIRYWDGATWTQQPPPTSTVADNHPAGRTGEATGLTTARGVCLILLALLFGAIAAIGLSEGPTDWDPYATELADTLWRIYFGTMLALCVITLILGVLSLTRPAAHPLYSVIAGILVIVVGVVGCGLGFFSVSTVDAMATFFGYAVYGFLFALGGAITTLLSAITLADQRRSGSRPSARPQPVGLSPGVRPATLGPRFLARLIDGTLVGVVAVPLALLAENHIATTGLFPGLFSGLLAFVYFVAFEVIRGWTPGKKLLGMQVHGPADTAKPTMRQSAIRNAFTVLAIIPFMGSLLALVASIVIAASIYSSPTKQGQHDKLAGGTFVVKD